MWRTLVCLVIFLGISTVWAAPPPGDDHEQDVIEVVIKHPVGESAPLSAAIATTLKLALSRNRTLPAAAHPNLRRLEFLAPASPHNYFSPAVEVRFSNGHSQIFSGERRINLDAKLAIAIFAHEDLLQSPRAIIFKLKGLRKLVRQFLQNTDDPKMKKVFQEMLRSLPYAPSLHLASMISLEERHDFFFAMLEVEREIRELVKADKISSEADTLLTDLDALALKEVSKNERLGLSLFIGRFWLLPGTVEAYARDLLSSSQHREYFNALPWLDWDLVELVKETMDQFQEHLTHYQNSRGNGSYRVSGHSPAEEAALAKESFDKLTLILYKAKKAKSNFKIHKIFNEFLLISSALSIVWAGNANDTRLALGSVITLLVVLNHWLKHKNGDSEDGFLSQRLADSIEDKESLAFTAALTHGEKRLNQGFIPDDQRDAVVGENLEKFLALTSLARQSLTAQSFCESLLQSEGSTLVRIQNSAEETSHDDEDDDKFSHDRGVNNRRRQR